MKPFSQEALKLIQEAEVATLSALGKDGSILSTLVWFEFDGETFQVNTERGTAKEINISQRKVATLLITDPNSTDYYVTARCELDRIQTEGALTQLDRLTKRHMNVEHWYGDVVADDEESKARSIIIHLRPVRLFEALD